MVPVSCGTRFNPSVSDSQAMGGWMFGLDREWDADVVGVPVGDRPSDWFNTAVPQLAGVPPPAGNPPWLVLIQITTDRGLGIRGKVKRLLDALHDQRTTGLRYAELGADPPLPDDHPAVARGLAVEVRSGTPKVRYRLGSQLEIRGRPLIPTVRVAAPCPNDVAASAEETARNRDARMRFARQLAAAWPRVKVDLTSAAVVICHPLGRDEDNTWEGWLGALTGAGWSASAWPEGAPLDEGRFRAVASVVDPRLSAGVTYDFYG